MIGMSVATATLRELPRMEGLAEVARRRARQLNRPVLVSVTIPVKPHDPLALFARGIGPTHNRFFWSVPAAGLDVAGLGAAWSVETSGAERFAAADTAWRDLVAHACVEADDRLPFAGPVAAAGFAFDPLRAPTSLWGGFPASLLLLPRIVLARVGDSASLTLNGLVGPETSQVGLHVGAARRLRELLGSAWRPGRPREGLSLEDALPTGTWRQIVGAAVAELRAGQMDKVVLARAVRARSETLFDTAAALDALRRDYPDTFVFAVARGGRTFLGASPERLVGLRGRAFAASGLAGSAARGATPAEDEALGAGLLASAKDQAEHAFVVQTIREALADLSDELRVPDTPTLMKMRNLQHLFTPISGRVAGETTLLDLVARLHPTPAVGGKPRELALTWIRERERLDRGWYAGPVGWLDAHGQGEFAVALRSALVGRCEATLFAGCGIVAGSDPEREEHETQLKLRPMLAALGAGT